jgi:hypothetical protein
MIAALVRQGGILLIRIVAASIAILAGCAITPSGPAGKPPIVFVHGNGDTAGALDHYDLALREQRLAARAVVCARCTEPSARSDDAKPQEGRTS